MSEYDYVCVCVCVSVCATVSIAVSLHWFSKCVYVCVRGRESLRVREIMGTVRQRDQGNLCVCVGACVSHSENEFVSEWVRERVIRGTVFFFNVWIYTKCRLKYELSLCFLCSRPLPVIQSIVLVIQWNALQFHQEIMLNTCIENVWWGDHSWHWPCSLIMCRSKTTKGVCSVLWSVW